VQAIGKCPQEGPFHISYCFHVAGWSVSARKLFRTGARPPDNCSQTQRKPIFL